MASGDPSSQLRMAVLQGDVLDLVPDPILQQVAAQAANLTGAEWAAIALQLRRTLLLRASHCLPKALPNPLPLDDTLTFCTSVIRDGRPLVVEDAGHDPRATVFATRGTTVRSFIGAPLVIDDAVVGALCGFHARERAIDTSRIDELIDLAEVASARLAVLARRRQPSNRLLDLAMRPAFAEIRNDLTPMQAEITEAKNRLQRLVADSVEARSGAHQSIVAMTKALDRLQQTTARLTGNLSSLQALCCGADRAIVRDVVQVADELAYHHTQLVGGVSWDV
ncbi:MAG TPA: GAF domain-containing protein, partial [Kofleriaceae bacterium]